MSEDDYNIRSLKIVLLFFFALIAATLFFDYKKTELRVKSIKPKTTGE